MVSYLQNVSLAAREGKDCYCIYNIKGYFWWQQLTFLLLWELAWSTLNWQEVYLIVQDRVTLRPFTLMVRRERRNKLVELYTGTASW